MTAFYSLFPIPCITSTGGEAANAQVCKTCIRGFETRPVLQIFKAAKKGRNPSHQAAALPFCIQPARR